MSLADVRRPQVDPKLAQIRQLQDELWKLEGPSAEEIQAAKAAAQKVPGTATQELLGAMAADRKAPEKNGGIIPCKNTKRSENPRKT